MFKNLFLFLAIALIPQFVKAQDDMPDSIDEVITWHFSVTYEGDEAILNMTVDQKDHWHIYSQVQPDGAVAFPTSFDFEKSDKFELVGSTKEYGAEEHESDGYPEKYFPGEKAKFKQRIKIKSKEDFTIKMEYSFMACKTACFAPQWRDHEFKIKGASGNNSGTTEEETGDTGENDTEEGADVEEEGNEALLKSPIGFQAFATYSNKTDYEIVVTPIINGVEYFLMGDKSSNPLNIDIKGEFEKVGDISTPEFKDSSIFGLSKVLVNVFDRGSFTQKIKIDPKDSAQIVNVSINFAAIDTNGNIFQSLPTELEIPLAEAFYSENSDGVTGRSYWGIFFLAFGGGLLALLTPCVFPMIPMTVSFFTKGSEDRKKGLFRGIMYGTFIFLIYVLLSLPFHLIDKLDPSILNGIGTHGPLNLFFFAMLTLFAISFLGAFEITMPSKLTNSADKKSNLGGIIGIFFMALTLALVSFSCTGPILGGLLASASSASGGAWNLTVGMAGFGVALGLPFALFAIFPGWLNSLPKSGGWLNNVKVVLGLLELALAFKFLSVADIYWDAHLLERELFIAIWVGIFLVMGLYLFGIFRTKHDTPTEGIGTFRAVTGIVAIIFSLYLLPGMWGAPVKYFSALLPPEHYSEIPYGIHGSAPPLPDGASYEHNLVVFHDFEDAEKYSEETGKPIMIDFTGENCVNCRKMENNVWSDEKVHELMDKDFVIASLYVDDREPLPVAETSPFSGRKLETYGDKWADFQSQVFKKNSQPQYVILDQNGGMINSDASYRTHGSPDKFKIWLKSGRDQFELRGDIKVKYGKVYEDTLAPKIFGRERDFSLEGGEELKSDIPLK
ncbi:thioredoxin family protein [Paracrocinitomix mangrovi]|uniref:protein-disulfide reductase DsbD family protein n=1 Tax=Paracrocinitomix mangrovi TaxID=2862509 RepID=UPI001C8D5317|nr:thioredoxin family protein [Paracrocinitomix mangrovi]UKN01223.1 thioredoxin family protein [Paracrocinitomix mangrovi]